VFNEFTLKNQTMWCDGYFNPHRYDHLGFDEYTLRHACFGDDGDQNDSGSDPGQGDFVGKDAEKDEQMPTPEDFAGLVDSGQMTPADVPGALAEAGGKHAKADPYADMIAHGWIAPPGKEDARGATPEELGFTPTFGYGSKYDPYAGGSVITDDGLVPGAFVSYDPGKVSDQQLGQSYADALYGSRDIGSDIASLFGIGSPVEFDPNKGFYEGTTFDPFDSPIIGLALSALNPGLGALYGVGKLASGKDPVGGVLGMLGPAGRALSTGITGYELLTDKDVNVSNLAGLPGLGFDTSINLSDYYTSSPNKADPVDDFLGGMKDTVSGALGSLNPNAYDPTAGAVNPDFVGPPSKSDPTVSDMQQQAIDAAAVDAAQAQAAAAAAAEAMFGPNYAPGEVYGVNPLGIGT
jgi:hypothetical protein